MRDFHGLRLDTAALRAKVAGDVEVLMIASHATGVVDRAELLDMRAKIDGVKETLGPVFWQVGVSHQRYADYIQTLT